jgi:hypothetical protein
MSNRPARLNCRDFTGNPSALHRLFTPIFDFLSMTLLFLAAFLLLAMVAALFLILGKVKIGLAILGLSFLPLGAAGVILVFFATSGM